MSHSATGLPVRSCVLWLLWSGLTGGWVSLRVVGRLTAAAAHLDKMGERRHRLDHDFARVVQWYPVSRRIPLMRLRECVELFLVLFG